MIPFEHSIKVYDKHFFEYIIINIKVFKDYAKKHRLNQTF